MLLPFNIAKDSAELCQSTPELSVCLITVNHLPDVSKIEKSYYECHRLINGDFMAALGKGNRFLVQYIITAILILIFFPSTGLSTLNSDLTELSIEELMNIEVTSVSKKQQKLIDAAAAVFVITAEDIRRSGATCIPDLLRIVPGLEVARIDTNRWAITSRGFNNYYASKLLVMIDGRSVYTPLFSGVYWDVQDTLLRDIERIEVIRGPGATLWGANAVNGVINIITKSAKDTQGGLVTAGVGNEEEYFGSIRYGASLGEDVFFRSYAKYFKRDSSAFSSGDSADDDWDAFRAGFRMDCRISDSDSLIVTGDIYTGDEGQTLLSGLADTVEVAGGNLSAHWNRIVSEASEMTIKGYYSRTEREDLLLREVRDTLDFDFQNSVRLGEVQEIVWGLGYRFTQDETFGSPVFSFDPDCRNDHLFSAFIQDEITLYDDQLQLILGSKFEHNDFTGFEIQPSIRVLWTPEEQHTIWAAVSRAVRTPSRSNHDMRLNGLVVGLGYNLWGDEDFASEELLAYEIGYRITPVANASVDMAVFYNVYDNLLTNETGSIPLIRHFDNKVRGNTYGVEVAANWGISEHWKVAAAYTFLQIQQHLDSSSTDITREDHEGDCPHNQINLRSYINLPHNLEFDQVLYYVDNLPAKDVGSYIRIDLRLGWHPTDKLEVSICGQNLFDRRHQEYGDGEGIAPTEVERSIYGKIIWQF